MKTHIGRRIKKALGLRKIPAAELAESLQISKQAAYRIFKKQHLNTEVLMKISELLNHDFFQYFQPQDDLPGRHKIEKQKLKAQVQLLEKEAAHLREINQLLARSIRE